MNRMSRVARMTLGLVVITLSSLLLADICGIVAKPETFRNERRVAICEALAINCSLLARTDNIEAIKSNISAIAQRNPDIVSAALRRNTGSVLGSVGDHQEHWAKRKVDNPLRSDPNHIVVPILQQGKVWGSLEVAFGPLVEQGWWPWLGHYRRSWPALLVFCGLINGLSIYWYLRPTMMQRGSSQTVPGRIRAALDTLANGLVVLDAENYIVLANKAFAVSIGQASAQLVGQDIKQCDWRGDDLPSLWAAAHRKPQVGVQLRLGEGAAEQTFLVNTSPVTDDFGIAQGALVSFADVTELQKKETAIDKMSEELRRSRKQIQARNRELRVMASRDGLTGCLNRRAVFAAFDRHWNESHRRGSLLSCAMIDVDFLRRVNEDYGHLVGDKVLRAVADTIQAQCQRPQTLCRYDSEEFCQLVLNCDVGEYWETAEQIRTAIEQLTFSETGLRITVSIGLSDSSMGAVDVRQLLDQADQALHAAKRTGRNRVFRWDDVTERKQPVAADRAVQPEVEHQSSSISYPAVASLLSALASRDPETAAHSSRVAEISFAVGRGLMSAQESYTMETAALLHDVGKIGVPDKILLKPAPLTKEEWRIMSAHDQIGLEIIESSFQNPQLVEIVKNYRRPFQGHHGQRGPCGEDIPLAARIIAIADAYDSMVSDRAYRKGSCQADAFGELLRCAGSQWDPKLVGRFIAVMEDYETPRHLDVSTRNQAALQLGLQLERLALAVDAEDVEMIQLLAERLSATASVHDIGELKQRADDLVSAADDDSQLNAIVVMTRELLDMCRSAQRSHLTASTLALDVAKVRSRL